MAGPSGPPDPVGWQPGAAISGMVVARTVTLRRTGVRFPPAPQDKQLTRGLIFQASLSFLASSRGTPLHTIAQRRVRSHVVQYVHLVTFVSMRARSGSGQIRSLGQDRILVRISAGVDAATQPARTKAMTLPTTRHSHFHQHGEPPRPFTKAG